MKGRIWITLALAMVLVFSASAFAAQATFDSGSTGVDGELAPTGDVEIQLPPDGKLNYTNVNIPSGVTVTFKKNDNNTPVYMLATGDVLINGAVVVSASSSPNTVFPGQGGPGGYDGGYGGVTGKAGGNGLGPGGGNGGCYRCGNYYGHVYSGGGGQGLFNVLGEKLVTLVGGSGGGGGGGNISYTGGGGGGGGGALLIAASGTITVNGSVRAKGGNGGNGGYSNYSNGPGGGGGGSGGAIKLMATTITGNGEINAAGGSRACSYGCGVAGGSGKVRLEALTLLRTAGTTPGYSYGYPGSVFTASLPELNIVSVGGTNAPSDIVGSFKQPDIILERSVTNPVDIVVSASNVPTGSTVTVSVVPEWGDKATSDITLEGTTESSSATASMSLSREYASVVMATVTFDLTLASAEPMFLEGEKVVKMRISTEFGGKSSVVYITESGREITAS